jgi:hypothetical protein
VGQRQCAARQAGVKVVVVDMGVPPILIDHMACSTKRSPMARKIWPRSGNDPESGQDQTGIRIMESEFAQGSTCRIGRNGDREQRRPQLLQPLLPGIRQRSDRSAPGLKKNCRPQDRCHPEGVKPTIRIVDALDVLIKLGGFEIAGLAGVALRRFIGSLSLMDSFFSLPCLHSLGQYQHACWRLIFRGERSPCHS